MKLLLAGMLLLVAGSPEPTLKPLGVCRIDADSVACWTLQGAPDSALTEMVSSKIGSLDQSISFVYGQKNRFLIARQGMLYGLSAGPQATVLRLENDRPDPLVAIRIVSAAQAKSGVLNARIDTLGDTSVEVPFRSGVKGQIDGTSFEFGPIHLAYQTNGMNWFYSNGSAWRFVVEVSSDSSHTTAMGGVMFEAIGRDGKSIRFVDLRGKPFDTVKGEAEWKRFAESKWNPSQIPTCIYTQISFENGASSLGSYVTNVDPKQVSKLRVRKVKEHRETIGPFPLDPN